MDFLNNFSLFSPQAMPSATKAPSHITAPPSSTPPPEIPQTVSVPNIAPGPQTEIPAETSAPTGTSKATPSMKQNIFDTIIKAIKWQESSNGRDPKAKGNVMQVGSLALQEYNRLAQEINKTSKQKLPIFKLSDMNNPKNSEFVGRRYFAYLLSKYKGDVIKAIEKYNAGGDPNYVHHIIKRLESIDPNLANDLKQKVAGLQTGTSQTVSHIDYNFNKMQTELLTNMTSLLLKHQEEGNLTQKKLENIYKEYQDKLGYLQSAYAQIKLNLPEPPTPPKLQSIQQQLGVIGNLVFAIMGIVGAIRGGKILDGFIQLARGFKLYDEEKFNNDLKEYEAQIKNYQLEASKTLDEYNALVQKIASSQKLAEEEYKIQEKLVERPYQTVLDEVNIYKALLDVISKINANESKNKIAEAYLAMKKATIELGQKKLEAEIELVNKKLEEEAKHHREEIELGYKKLEEQKEYHENIIKLGEEKITANSGGVAKQIAKKMECEKKYGKGAPQCQ